MSDVGEGYHDLRHAFWHGTPDDLVAARWCVVRRVGRYVVRVYCDSKGRAAATGWYLKGV